MRLRRGPLSTPKRTAVAATHPALEVSSAIRVRGNTVATQRKGGEFARDLLALPCLPCLAWVGQTWCMVVTEVSTSRSHGHPHRYMYSSPTRFAEKFLRLSRALRVVGSLRGVDPARHISPLRHAISATFAFRPPRASGRLRPSAVRGHEAQQRIILVASASVWPEPRHPLPRLS
jgi:hypothetical protein